MKYWIPAVVAVLGLFVSSCGESQVERLIQKANDEWVKGRNHSAVELFKSVLEKYPSGPHAEEALFRLGEIYHFGLSDSSQAIVYFMEALQLSRRGRFSYEAQRYIADIVEFTLKDYDQAIIENQKLINEFGHPEDDPERQFRIASIYFKKQNYEQSIVELEILLEKYPDSEWAEEGEFRIMEVLFTLNRCDDAKPHFEHFLKSYSKSKYMHEMDFVRASCLEEEGKLEEALRVFQSLSGQYRYPALVAMKIEGIEKRIRKVR
ncbi:MAG: tetratricopeptide repeat protein [Nitrospinae bacterium]|nr:tetratricopeptide repeat protein [Nitrospinota bacterium]